MEQTYSWKILLKGGKYTDSTDDLLSFETEGLDLSFLPKNENPEFENSFLVTNFLQSFQCFTIPVLTRLLIDDLISEYSLEGNLRNHFYLLACVFQYHYADAINNLEDDYIDKLDRDFKYEFEGLEQVLGVIQKRLESGNLILDSITFRTKDRENVTIDNFFIVKEIYQAMEEFYGISLDNFEYRKKKLINDTNDFMYSKRDEYVKYIIAKTLFDYINSMSLSTAHYPSECVKFVGQFLFIYNIPINKKYFEIPEVANVNDFLSGDDIKFLRLFISRPKKFFIRK